MAHTPDRPAYINGLRDLADFLDTNPDIPIPNSALTAYYYPRGTDEEICDQVAHVARVLGADVDPRDLAEGHFSAGIAFGVAEYKAVGLLASSRARWAARRSYEDSITLDSTDPRRVPEMTGTNDDLIVIRYRCATCGGTGVDSMADTCRDCDGTGADNHGA
ncbi:hypothetical protein ACWEN6_38765 [Sphaerisporangium sp. NPDC004334]